MVGGLGNVHIHFAGLGTSAAGNAFVLIHLHLEQGHPVKQGVKRTQGANPFAEGAVKEDAAQHHRQQDECLPGEQLSQCRPNAGVGGSQGKGTFQHALGTQVLAEEGVSHAQVVDHQNGKQHHHHHQDDVFQIGQRFEAFGGKFLGGDFVQQLLEPAKGAQKPADDPPQQHPQQNQNAGDVIGKAELGGADHRLKGADGTGTRCAGTGIAVQPGDAHIFSLALVQCSF